MKNFGRWIKIPAHGMSLLAPDIGFSGPAMKRFGRLDSGTGHTVITSGQPGSAGPPWQESDLAPRVRAQLTFLPHL
jgi:hypothetical protein